MSTTTALGYIAVKNRSQAQIRDNTSLDVALTEEYNYLNLHSVWKNIPKESKGIPALRTKLTTVLFNLANESLPDMKREIISRLDKLNVDLAKLGDPPIVDPVEGRRACLFLLSHFGILLRQLASGNYHDPIAQTDTQLRIKYRLEKIQIELRQNISGEIPDFESDEYTAAIESRIVEMRGRELPGFISSRLLLSTVALDIESWRIEVEKAFAASVEVFAACATRLIDIMAPQVI